MIWYQDELTCIKGDDGGIGKYTWSLLDARKGIKNTTSLGHGETDHVHADLYDAILNGNIPQAFTLIHRHFPALAAYDTQDPMKLEIEQQKKIDTDLQYIIFKLRCQQFIEIVRTSSEIEAIQFAQAHLKPMHKDYRDLTNEVASLIAYPDPHNASCSHLLSQERRRQLADEVNKVVLGKMESNDVLLVANGSCWSIALSNLRHETALERIKRHAEVIASERAAYHLDIPEDLDKPHSASAITEPSSPY